MEKHHKKARQTKRQVWSDSVSAYVRAHVRVRVRAGAYKRVRACVFVRAYLCSKGWNCAIGVSMVIVDV